MPGIEEGVTIALGVHKILKDRGVYEKVLDFLTRKQPQHILVLGASGTGKSSFLRFIKGLDPYIRPEERTDRATPVDGKIEGKADGKTQKSLFHFIDTPGEVQHSDKRKKAILDAYSVKSLGIINVASYGYHEGAVGGDKAVEGVKPSQNYLEASRALELNQLAEWTSLLAGRGGPAKWLITVVTKADLWWTPDGGPAVLEYYRTGAYEQALGEAKGINHSVRIFSSLNQLFFGRAAMTGFYSDDRRLRDRESLVASLLEYASERAKD